jgi:adenylate cyclase
MVFRTDTLLMTGIAYISNGKFCQQSESLVTLRRATCGPVFRNNPESGKEPFTYVNATEIFQFKPID